MSVWGLLTRGRRGILIACAALLCLALVALLFDERLSAAAIVFKHDAGNETLRLGEFFQVTRIFGVADTVVFLGLLLGLAGWRRFFLRLMLSLLVVAALVHPVKILTQRHRPDQTNYHSFPSGDSATAFTLPVAFMGHPLLAAGSALAATGAATSRVFYAKHYPSDVLTGAAVGLLAGLIGRWLARRIRWLPSQNLLLWATVLFLAGELLNALIDGHHRHIVQFIAFYGPALALLIAHNRLKLRFGRSAERWKNARPGADFYYFIRRALTCSTILGGLMIVLPWLADAPGLRAPALSAGLLLIVFACLSARSLRGGRWKLAAADGASLLYIIQAYALGYLLGIL